MDSTYATTWMTWKAFWAAAIKHVFKITETDKKGSTSSSVSVASSSKNEEPDEDVELEKLGK